MKKVLISALALMVAVGVYAQGSINFANNASSKVMISPNLDGSAAVAAPVGATYQVGLYWAPAGTTDPNSSAFQLVGASANIVPLAGLFSGGTRTVPGGASGIAPGAICAVQIRGWQASAGNYETASTTAGDYSGKSTVFAVDTGDPTVVPAGTPGSIIGVGQFTGFTMVPTPEPSTIALGILGLAGLFVLRRRS
jgi:hypothetical protein